MPFDPQRFSGIHSLDVTQAIDAQKGTYWESGAAVTLTTATATIETHVDTGKQIRGGVEFDIPEANVAHTDGDPTNPRWDTVCVINNNGGIQVFEGTPAPVVLDQDGNELRGEEAYTPSPSDTIPVDAIPLAMVWIPAGATNNNDLTDEPTGGVANPVVDRRITTGNRAEQYTRRAVIETAGWYRIAVNGDPENTQGGNRCMAFFDVRDTQSGFHSSRKFHAGAHFGRNPTITSIGSSHFGNNGAIKRARLIVNGTYDGHALEVYVDPGSRAQVNYAEYSIWQNRIPAEWEPVDWQPGNVPTGFSVTELDFTDSPPLAVAANGNEVFRLSRDGHVTANSYSPVYPENVGASMTITVDYTVTESLTRVPFDAVGYDHFNMADPGTGQMTIPKTGQWLTQVNLAWLQDPAFDTATQLRSVVSKADGAGGVIRSQSFDQIGPGTSQHVTTNIAQSLSFDKGDIVEIKALQLSGTGTELNAGFDWTMFSMAYLGGN